MEKLILITVFISSSLLCFTSIDENGMTLFSKDLVEQTTDNSYQISDINNLLKDCTVRIDTELEDGTTIQGEITFIDVTWWQCTKMQLAAWWDRNF